MLGIVDRASKFLFAYPLSNKTAENVAKKLLKLLSTFEIPLSLRSDPVWSLPQRLSGTSAKGST